MKNPFGVAAKFIYSDFIQNRGYELYDIERLRAAEPECYLSHGKGILQSVQAYLKGQ